MKISQGKGHAGQALGGFQGLEASVLSALSHLQLCPGIEEHLKTFLLPFIKCYK